MKKHLINLSLSLIVFVLCLSLVEVFFQLNAKYHWIEQKAYTPKPSTQEHPSISDEGLKTLITKHQKFEPANYSMRSTLTSWAPHTRELIPFPPEFYIQGKVDFENSKKIISDRKIQSEKQLEIFKVNYEFDKDRIRITEGAHRNPNSKNLVLLGCSMVFGTGVDQGQDIGSFMTQYMPGYNIYNMGIPSAGLSDMLDDAFIYQRLKANQKGGAVVYLMIYDHLERTLCSLDCYGDRKSWVLTKNYYDFNQNHQLTNFGPHKDNKPIKYFLYTILAKSEFLRFIGYQRPKIYSTDEIEKYLEFVKALKDFYKSKFNLDFYVYLANPSPEFPVDIMSLIEKHDIKGFTYGIESREISERAFIVGDGHWNQLGNDYQALAISEYLKKNGY